MPDDYDLLIIGGGPAGLTAGLYAARARLNVLLFDPTGGGGWLNNTQLIENYPGFPDGISGPELGDAFIRQAQKFGLKIQYEKVTQLVPEQPLKILKTDSGEYRAPGVIICTGSRPIALNIPGESKFAGRGVSNCATCDAALFKDRTVAVIGGGNSAVDEALAISRHAGKVYIIHRRETLRAEKLLQDLAFANEKIEFVWNSIAESINGEDAVESISLRNIKTSDTFKIDVDGVFIFIGTAPNTDFLKGAVELDERGYIVLKNRYETSVHGVWAAGDVHDSRFRQAVTAAGHGAASAMLADDFLRQQA